MNNALRVLIFVVVMGTAAGLLLIGVSAFTSPMISRNEELKTKSSVLSVLEISYSKSDIIKIFDEQIKISKRGAYTFYNGPDSSLAFEFRGPGLWGPISGFISLEKDMKTIRKIKITHQEETPGLGGRIAEADYLKQFKNKVVLPSLVFVPAGKAARNNEVDSITGATGSSRAMERLINENVKKYLSAIKG